MAPAIDSVIIFVWLREKEKYNCHDRDIIGGTFHNTNTKVKMCRHLLSFGCASLQFLIGLSRLENSCHPLDQSYARYNRLLFNYLHFPAREVVYMFYLNLQRLLKMLHYLWWWFWLDYRIKKRNGNGDKIRPRMPTAMQHYLKCEAITVVFSSVCLPSSLRNWSCHATWSRPYHWLPKLGPPSFNSFLVINHRVDSVAWFQVIQLDLEFQFKLSRFLFDGFQVQNVRCKWVSES